MALLHRFLRLNDPSDTASFTFIVTRSVTREAHKDFTSKDFAFGYHKWALGFTIQERHLGIFLVWRNVSQGMKVFIDMNITIIDREHFSGNLSFRRKGVKFTIDAQAQGNRKLVPLSSLEKQGRFVDRNGEFQVEVVLSSVRSVYEHKFRMNQSFFVNGPKLAKLESSYFKFGSYDWSLSIYPQGKAESQLGTPDSESMPSQEVPGMVVYLNRHTGLDRTCRIKFHLWIGTSPFDGNTMGQGMNATISADSKTVDSGLLDEMSNSDGKSFGWLPRVRLSDFVNKGALKLSVELSSVHTVSKLELSVVPPTPIGVPLYDKDKLAWELETDLHGETLRLRLVFKDAKNIPRNHIRYVCWTAYVLKSHPKLLSALGDGPDDYTEKINFDQRVYSQYYVQDETEAGTLMDTKIPIKEIIDPANGYLMNRSDIRVHIEWLQSCLLFQSTYHHYDDIARIQAHQMRIDIENLRLENELLERRLTTFEQESLQG